MLKYCYIIFTYLFGGILIPFMVAKRLKKGKEHADRYPERYGISYAHRDGDKQYIWLHGASLGEISALLPLIDGIGNLSEKYHILLTYQTLSAANMVDKIIKHHHIKDITHQFIPYDVPQYCQRFITYWQPTKAIFSESEIWLNMFTAIKRHDIAHYYVNARAKKKI